MRLLPLSSQNRDDMLRSIGVDSAEDLFVDVPEEARLLDKLSELKFLDEASALRYFSQLAKKNTPAGELPFFLGGGAYKHHIPATVDHLVQRSEFMTAYTPYQPEIAQGTLQVLFEFQTQVSELLGLEVANCSLYDGASAAAEAVSMACRVTRKKEILICSGLHPHYKEAVKTICGSTGISIVSTDERQGEVLANDIEHKLTNKIAAVVVQMPSFYGDIFDLTQLAKAAHEKGALLVAVFNEPSAFGLIEAPGAMGADIVAGEGRSLGSSLNFGGPALGLFACLRKFVRQMPGHIVGQSVDVDGRRSFTLTLVAREQHIRREKATSNVCTNSGLCALAFSIHMALLGAKGLRKMAEISHLRAIQLVDGLSYISGIEVLSSNFYNEITIKVRCNADEFVRKMLDKGIFAGIPISRFIKEPKNFDQLLLVATSEITTQEDIKSYLRAASEIF